MIRPWLPNADDVAADLQGLDASGPGRWRGLRRIAGRDLDLPLTMRLDRAIRKSRVAASEADLAGLQPVRLAVLSTSTTSHLAAGLRVMGLGRGLLVDLYEPDYGQHVQELATSASPLHAFHPSAVLFAQDPYALVGLISPVADEAEAERAVGGVVDTLRAQWRRAREAWGALVLQQLPFNPFPRLLGENETRLPTSPAALLARFQQALRAAAVSDHVDLIDLDHWAGRRGIEWWHARSLWHRAKQEVNPLAAPLYGDLVARVLAARYGRSAKCLVLDLDQTVWGGVIGDDGIEGIVIGQGSALGEAHVAFQRYAQQLARRGIILAVCSKNDESVARRAFAEHPEMILKVEDISCFVANWTDKATNLRRIAKELNIGLDALVFADDNPFERNLIRTEVPEVFVPELGEDPADFAQIVADAGCFETTTITSEDVAKTSQYEANARRQNLAEQVTDLDAYLAALDMTLRHAPFDGIGLARIVQLINKTNQFNLTTRRYTEDEVRSLMADPNAVTMQMRLIDRFGDNGMIGVVIGRKGREAGALTIETWLMSCRVLGRRVEEATLALMVEAARREGLATIIGEYAPTGRNGMVADHYARLGFTHSGTLTDGRTHWTLHIDRYNPPSSLPVDIRSA